MLKDIKKLINQDILLSFDISTLRVGEGWCVCWGVGGGRGGLLQLLCSAIHKLVDDKTFIGFGDVGYRFIQSRRDNIQLGLTASSDITRSTE